VFMLPLWLSERGSSAGGRMGNPPRSLTSGLFPRMGDGSYAGAGSRRAGPTLASIAGGRRGWPTSASRAGSRRNS
jgi:hypothetical protein